MWKLIQCVTTVNLFMVLNGFGATWASAYLPQLQIEGMQSVLIISVGPTAAALILLVQTSVVNRIGRKRTILYSSILYISGWFLLSGSTTFAWLCVSHALIGLGQGVTFPSVPMYLSEIAPVDIRGAVTCSSSILLSLGIVLLYVQALYLSVRVQAILSGVLAVLIGALTFGIVETPYQLLLRGDYESAERSLRRLRGDGAKIDDEMKSMVNLTEIDLSTNTRFLDIYHQPANRKALVLVASMTLVFSLSANNILNVYGVSIFDATGTSLAGGDWTIVMSVLGLFGAMCTSIIVDLLGRRRLLLLSLACGIFGNVLVGVYFTVQRDGHDVARYSSAASGLIILVYVSHVCGFASVGQLITSELFTTSLKAKGFLVCAVINNFHMVLSATVIQTIWMRIGIDVCFYVFAVSNIVCTLYVVLWIPETARKTFEEIYTKYLTK